jgi:hypothetical protein
LLSVSMGGVHARPLSPAAVVRFLADRFLAQRDRRREAGLSSALQVAIDGAPAAGPAALADALADALVGLGVAPLRVRSEHFLRAASLRFERGRDDPDAFYEDWLDVSALVREVLAPLGPQGSGRYLPSRWDAGRDRATRAPYEVAPESAVLLVDGTFLLGRALPWNDSVHLALSPAALRRRTLESERWTLPAFERYEREVRPASVAGVVLAFDDPRHPALVDDRG